MWLGRLVFFASIFVAYVEPKLFFHLCVGKFSSAAPNKRKRKAVHAQAHARATTLVAKERMKLKENFRMTAQVIAQVEGEFRTQRRSMRHQINIRGTKSARCRTRGSHQLEGEA